MDGPIQVEVTRGDVVEAVHTVHAVAVEGEWRWILSPRRFGIYRSRACPTAESSQGGA